MNPNRSKIVIADDDTDVCLVLSDILRGEGYAVECVYDGFELIAYLKENQDIDIVILDLVMPEKGGMTIFNTIKSVSPASRIIIYTGYTNYKHSIFAREADAFVNKTEGVENLLKIIKGLA